MKTRIVSIIGLLLLTTAINSFGEKGSQQDGPFRESTLRIACTPDLKQLVTAWAFEYNGINSGVNIQVTEVPDKMNFSVQAGDLLFVSGTFVHSVTESTAWKMALGRDVIVPVIHAGNPFIGPLSQSGVSALDFTRIMTHSDKLDWGSLVQTNQTARIHLFVPASESLLSELAHFLGIPVIPAEGVFFVPNEEIVKAVQNDPYAIGFTTLNELSGPQNATLPENLRFLPIDKNGNGTLDRLENIYEDVTTFTRGVWMGKYPRSLINEVFAVAADQPVQARETDFLKWILTDGRNMLNQNGYGELARAEMQSKLQKLTPVISYEPPSPQGIPATGLILIIVTGVLALSLITGRIVYVVRARERAGQTHLISRSGIFKEETISLPAGVFFDKTHTWAFMEKDGYIRLGIDDFLQHVTGPFTRIEMKNPGERIKKGDVLLTLIQKGKQLRIYSPVTGIIKEHNTALHTRTEAINSSPYAEGWVYAIEPVNWMREIQFMDMAEKYRIWLSGEFSRLKDFLARALQTRQTELATVVLQDGGALKENVLENLDPELWEDFQTHFLEKIK